MKANDASDIHSFSNEYACGRYNPKALILLLAVLLTVLPTEALAEGSPERNDRTLLSFNKSNKDAWDWLAKQSQCNAPISEACAQEAIVQVSAQCGASAKWFKKDTKKWKWISFGLVLASATFTAVGASSTLANAKIYSTLGGTTGLGAVTTTVTANLTSDQAGLATVNNVLANFIKFVQTGGDNNKPPTSDLIYKSAPLYAAQCEAAANGSSGAVQQ